MSNNGITFDISEVMAGLERKMAEIEAAALREMGDCMDDLLAESTNIAPLDKATLRNSAWQETKSDGDAVEGAVYYTAVERDKNGRRFNYALRVHEMGEYKNPSTPGTRPKFLSETLKKNAAAYKQRVAAAIRKAVT
jgi:hypothetical protein